MNHYKKITIFVLSIIFGMSNLCGQDVFDLQIIDLKNQYPIPKLSKTEMYADFDTLISIMERCNAQYLIRKKVTGYDMVAEMKAQRTQIKNCYNTVEFIKLLRKILFLTLDEHCFIGSSVWWYRHDFYENDVAINNITDKEYGINFHYLDSVFYIYSPKLDFIYNRGKYFLKNTTTFFNGTDSIVVPLGSEILTFNNQIFADYQSSIKTQGTKWDFSKNKYYNTILYISSSKNSIGFRMGSKTLKYSFTKFIEHEKQWEPFKASEFYLHWFAKDSTLYFRIPKMSYNEEKMQEFREKIINYRSKPVKSVIIDIRGNEGGNDLVWRELLGLIIKEPIKYPFCLISNKDKDVQTRIIPETTKEISYDFIDSSHQFCVFEDEIDTIKVQTENLGYKNNVFIIVDEDIYSSAMGFASLCTKTNSIKTIGMSTGKLGGQGANAGVFVLPNSRLIFTLDLLLDASSVSKAEDFYHDYINYPVTPSIEYYKYWYNPNRPYEIDEKAMYKHDEVFKKALDIIRECDYRK